MTESALQTLQKYFGFSEFRPFQESIINSVLDKKDTLALLPTGGGKSVCFQVPALMQSGICIVVSPLIALMKDQVEHLQRKNIKAMALIGSLSEVEISDLLDNCLYGNFKFLYFSPERLQSEWFIERLTALSVNLIAIDEAHCVSQWGHDFRPAYLKINSLRKHFNNVPFIALTASATPRVKDDIITQLELKNPVVHQNSFERKNLAYMVFKTQDKLFKIEQILKKNPESSIIYVRNRKSCYEISNQLQQLGFSTTFYHGGLPAKEKETNMNLWIQDKVQVMVATNAFGMGIDKPNVRTVIHIQLPENIESYYQEAGRAGRDNNKAFAVVLLNDSDVLMAKNQFLEVLPDKTFVKQLYNKLFNHFQIAYGELAEDVFPLNFNEFCLKYQFNTLKAYNALLFLDRQGVITLSNEFTNKITLQFIIPTKEVMRYISLNRSDEEVIMTILRTYPGVFDVETSLNMNLISKKTGKSEAEIHQVLTKMKEREVISYRAKHNDITIMFNEVREDDRTVNRISNQLINHNKLKTYQLQSVIDYVMNEQVCKSEFLLQYFGEINTKPCGICSYCVGKKQHSVTDVVKIKNQIITLLSLKEMTSRDLVSEIKAEEKLILSVLLELIEDEVIGVNQANAYYLLT